MENQTREYFAAVDMVDRDIRGSRVLSYMIPVKVKPELFLTVKETLQRIGISSKKPNNKELFQTVHILHKKGEYLLCHFKQLYALDGKPHSLTSGDVARLNLIADLLEEWKLVEIEQPSQVEGDNPMASLSNIVILKHSECKDWKLTPKYAIGVKK